VSDLILLEHLTKVFMKDNETFKAVDDISLNVKKGEIVALLGPSGCGKTTILRMIAGFERPTAGRVILEGQDITALEPNKRKIGFVFQNYALFPHMNVFDNVSYGLKIRRFSQEEIRKKTHEVLEMVGLKGVEKRFINELSGGEQQRVALARAFVINPKVLLMDEPLSNLDAKLRIYMRAEIRRLQKLLGITCIYVTHDQKEALSIADRIAVMNKGKIEQVAPPFELYTEPKSLFVADFIGQANIFEGKVIAFKDGRLEVSIYDRVISARFTSSSEFKIGARVALVVRPEAVNLTRSDESALKGRILSSVFVGDRMEYQIELEPGHLIHAFIPYSQETVRFSHGEEVGILIDPESVLVMPF